MANGGKIAAAYLTNMFKELKYIIYCNGGDGDAVMQSLICLSMFGSFTIRSYLLHTHPRLEYLCKRH